MPGADNVTVNLLPVVQTFPHWTPIRKNNNQGRSVHIVVQHGVAITSFLKPAIT